MSNIDNFINDFNTKLTNKIDSENLKRKEFLDKRRSAIVIPINKVCKYPDDPKIKTIGDLFGYVFPMDGNIINEPQPVINGTMTNPFYIDYINEVDGKTSGDKVIGDIYKTLKTTYQYNINYQGLKDNGGGQYWFDYLIYQLNKMIIDKQFQDKLSNEIKNGSIKLPSGDGKKTSDWRNKDLFQEILLDNSDLNSYNGLDNIMINYLIPNISNTDLLYLAFTEVDENYKPKYTFGNPNIKSDIISSNISSDQSIDPKLEKIIDTSITETPKTLTTEVDGEFTFNIENDKYFKGDDNIGNLWIVGKGDLFENTKDSELDQIDEEYTEEPFIGPEEQPVVYETGGFVVTDIESLNSLRGVDPENFNDLLSTDTTSKYPIDKNTDSNIKKIINTAKNRGVTNQYAIAAMLAICKKESGFIPRSEAAYSGTKASRIKKVFSAFRKYSDSEVDNIKVNIRKFFDIIYGGKYGNASDEGFKYRGRGFNQITFKGNYSKYKGLTGHDIINDPDLLNTSDVAAACLVEFFKENFKSAPSSIRSTYNFTNINSFKNLDDAIGAFYHANAGWGQTYNAIVADPTGGRKKAFKYVGPLYNTYLK